LNEGTDGGSSNSRGKTRQTGMKHNKPLVEIIEGKTKTKKGRYDLKSWTLKILLESARAMTICVLLATKVGR